MDIPIHFQAWMRMTTRSVQRVEPSQAMLTGSPASAPRSWFTPPSGLRRAWKT